MRASAWRLLSRPLLSSGFSFFFNDTATPEIYTLSLHDALPISLLDELGDLAGPLGDVADDLFEEVLDRKSTRLNSSHMSISYAVFCLKKKNTLRTSPHLAPATLAVLVTPEQTQTVRPATRLEPP